MHLRFFSVDGIAAKCKARIRILCCCPPVFLQVSLSEIPNIFVIDVHPNQIQDWRKRLLENADAVFGQGQKQREASDEKLKELHAKIGQLTMERDFLERGLERIHGPSGKK